MSVKSNISVYHDFTFYILHFGYYTLTKSVMEWVCHLNKVSHQNLDYIVQINFESNTAFSITLHTPFANMACTNKSMIVI